MAICASCGSQSSGQICVNCGTTLAGGSPQAGGAVAAAPAASFSVAPNLASALCYFPLLAILFLLLAPYNKERTIRFHALQCLGLVVAMTVLQIALAVLGMIIHAIVPALAGPIEMVSLLVSLCGLLLFLAGMYMAYTDKPLRIPVIAPLAEKFV